MVGAVVVNAAALQLRLEAQKNLRSLAPETAELRPALTEAYSQAKASTENLRRSLTFGGLWIIGGMAAYGIGLTARSVTRKRKRDGWE